ncbi:quinoprotein relay system zinc metallohydrolase 2 [Nevskia sp.]|uniref:quinoprotein relay system zinc metallohydrolase 2 n=1 Tax=Nevskia sp. TaxID=1929292 RepID=UPI0025E8E701|nr:quinoprotein relay system zinc metallohydrolase 2 [Nevskia sp.]
MSLRQAGWQSTLASIVLLAGTLLTQATAAPDFSLEKVADGIYVHRGQQQDATAANGGDIANIGYIVGDRCVAVIDSGGSLAIGTALRDAIRRATAKPVCYVIHTHVHPDHSFGDAAFSDPATVFVAHAEYPAAMAARRDGFLANLKNTLGAAADGSDSAAPSLLVSDHEMLDLGNRRLSLQAWPTAHTNNDLTVFDERTQTLWTGDLLFVDRIPVVDGRALGWLKVMTALRALKPAHLIPGHGPVQHDVDAAFAPQRQYLDQLISSVRAALKAGSTLAQTVETLGNQLPQKAWLLFDDYHRRNVTAVYTELEWEN